MKAAADPQTRKSSTASARQPSKSKGMSPNPQPAAPRHRMSGTGTSSASSKTLSSRNLNNKTTTKSTTRRSGSKTELSRSLHSVSSTAAKKNGTARRRSGDGTTMASSAKAATTRTTPSRPTVRNCLSTSTHARTTGGRSSRPSLQKGTLSSRSVASSNRSLSSKESLQSRGSSTNKDSASANHHNMQDMQERIKQRAALRAATGMSSRSLRSFSSHDSKASSSRKPPTRTSSADGTALFNRRPALAVRSLSSSSLGSIASTDPRRRRSSNATAKQIQSPVSSQTKKEVQDLKQQILQVQKTVSTDDDCGNHMEASALRKQLVNARQTLAINEELPADVSPLASPQKSTEGISPSKPTTASIEASAIENMILSISNRADTNGDSQSTFCTQALQELQSYTKESRENSVRSARSRLDELRQSRRDQESQLLNMVQKQHAGQTAVDPTDVMAVIVNLRDELAAAQQVIEQQRIIMEILGEQAQENEKKESTEKSEQTSSLVGWLYSGTSQESSEAGEKAPEQEEPAPPLPPDTVPLKQYEALQSRYTKLQMDRAQAEFQLRTRITNDALKFHRRLRHWKDQDKSIELRCEIQNMENDHAQELVAAQAKTNQRIAELEKEHAQKLEELQAEADEKTQKLEKEYAKKLWDVQNDVEEFQQQADLAKQDLDDYKKSTEVAFDEFCDAKEIIEELEFEIEKLKSGDEDDGREYTPRRKYKQRLTRRSSKRSLDGSDDDATIDSAESGTALTSYLGSWLYGAAPANENAGKEVAENQGVPNGIDLSPRSPAARDSNPGDPASKEGDAAAWGAWGLTTYFNKEEGPAPDHEMNLTD